MALPALQTARTTAARWQEISGIAQTTAAPIEIFAKTLRKRYRKQLDIGAAKLEAALVEHLLRLARIGRR
ncbi:hypothetical protein ACC811_10140 [Rhizobium ruizarguesonis]|jgi:hypothetical protein